MNVFLLIPDISRSGPVWVNMLWPQVNALSECYDTVVLPVPSAFPGQSARMVGAFAEFAEMSRCRKKLVALVRERLHGKGPNILLVWAGNARMVKWARVLEPVWDRFDATVLVVTDSVQHWHVKAEWVSRFDRILFTCAELAQDYRDAFGLETRHWPAHTDVLSFHSGAAFRPIDMILVGRREPLLHDPLFRHFNRPSSDRLFLDFSTRGQMPMTHEDEFRLLMATYGRSKIAFGYETGSIPRYYGKSPLLARWVHAWAAGCTVVGTRPKGRGTEPLMDWEDSTIELPDDTGDAVVLIGDLLRDEAGLEARRRRNVMEALRRHDTRHRLRDLIVDLDLPVSERLTVGLAALRARADDLAATV